MAKKIESMAKTAGPDIMIKTADMGRDGVSDKLQKAGKPVIAVSGGSLGDRKSHYFKLSLKQAQELKGKDGKALLTANNLELCEEVEHVTPTKAIDTGLKEALNSKNKVTNPEADAGVGDAGTI